VSVYSDHSLLDTRTKSLNVFVVSSSASPSGLSAAAGGGDEDGEVDEAGSSPRTLSFLVDLSKSEGTSLSTFLLLIDDIVKLCFVVGVLVKCETTLIRGEGLQMGLAVENSK
jgi:hypothetical protein